MLQSSTWGEPERAVPTGHTYVQTIGTRDRARHVASRRICPHIHILCMPVCVPMSARPRSGSPPLRLVALVNGYFTNDVKLSHAPSRWPEPNNGCSCTGCGVGDVAGDVD